MRLILCLPLKYNIEDGSPWHARFIRLQIWRIRNVKNIISENNNILKESLVNRTIRKPAHTGKPPHDRVWDNRRYLPFLRFHRTNRQVFPTNNRKEPKSGLIVWLNIPRLSVRSPSRPGRSSKSFNITPPNN